MKKLLDIMLSEDSGSVDGMVALNIQSPTDNKLDQKRLQQLKQKQQQKVQKSVDTVAQDFVADSVGEIPNEDVAKLTARDPGEPSAEVERNIKVWTQSRIIEYVQSEAFLNEYIDRFGVHTGYDYKAFIDDIIKNLERGFKFKLQKD